MKVVIRVHSDDFAQSSLSTRRYCSLCWVAQYGTIAICILSEFFDDQWFLSFWVLRHINLVKKFGGSHTFWIFLVTCKSLCHSCMSRNNGWPLYFYKQSNLCSTTTPETPNLLLTGGRCSEVDLCYKDISWDSKMVVAIDRWSLAQVWLNIISQSWFELSLKND